MTHKKLRKQIRHKHRGRRTTPLSGEPTVANFAELQRIQQEKQTKLKTTIRTETRNYRQRELGILNVRFAMQQRSGNKKVYYTGTSSYGYVKSNAKEMFEEAKKSALSQYMRDRTGVNYANVILSPVDFHFTYYEELEEHYQQRIPITKREHLQRARGLK